MGWGSIFLHVKYMILMCEVVVDTVDR